ncbi:sensor histidine kinase [Nonomuraea africana]|uniref:histidine kinase n=1 Tax=Nonomuraea africana TaxID=46171 RepID=A0ABR9KPB8_9ACTN|nr:histidine kinase [Nonomuraea africana]MBE1563871.1 signal transduction histidine kinase [Nonomuraea africana]
MRALLYLVASAVPGLVAVAVAVMAFATPFAALLAVPAVPLVAWFERWRLGAPAARHRWRELGLGLASLLVLWWIDLVMIAFAVGGPIVLIISPAVQEDLGPAIAASVAGAVLVPVGGYVLVLWGRARMTMARELLEPHRLEEVVASRARLVDAFDVERRRIERDLHDGAQQRLVALSMRLGLAKLDLPPGSPAAEQVASAHEEARQALVELRELIRGVHPQVLTDRGLAAAIREAASRSPVPVEVETDLDRLPEQVETAAYYVVSEALANIAKHSGASRAWIRASGRFVMEIGDDGKGGADPARGSGLTGLADRLAVVGGRLSLSSPAGGPTTMRVEIPCE